MFGTGSRSAAMSLVLVAALVLVQTGSAQAESIQGSILQPHGNSLRLDRIRYTGSGCAEDIRDGVVGAYIDVRGAKKLKLAFKSADVRPPGTAANMVVHLFPGCDPENDVWTQTCMAAPVCSLPIEGERFAQLTYSHDILKLPYYGVHFTVELT